MELEVDTFADVDDKYIRPESAEKKIKEAQITLQTVYIYGASGFGKTSFIKNFLGRRKYIYLQAGDIAGKLPEPSDLKQCRIVVIDDFHLARSEELLEFIEQLEARRVIWLILIGRGEIPPWLLPISFKRDFALITEEDLTLSESEVKKCLLKWIVTVDEETLHHIYVLTCGCGLPVRIIAMELARGSQYSPAFVKAQQKKYWQYLEYHVYAQWSRELQDFLMELSLVECFDIYFAEMMTGRQNVEALIAQAKVVGNFILEKNGKYYLRRPLRLSMRHRLNLRCSREERDKLYYNAGRAYESLGMITDALAMYEACGNGERISELLVDNARKDPGTGYYYELRHYYLSLPEETVKKHVELMAGMSMLESILLNCEESERWYQELKSFEKHHSGSQKRAAASWILYLDIGLPHRGSAGLVTLFKNAGALLLKRQVVLPSFSVTSNLPSLMNGGKDFCQWSKRDKELAASIGKVVVLVLGKYGKGLVCLALAESGFERGADDDEVSDLANRGRIQAEAGGKLELNFVGVGILTRLYVIHGRCGEAKELLDSFYCRAEQEGAVKLLPNIKAMACRLALYEENREAVERWMAEAPSEGDDFCTFDRYRYLTKARVYLYFGKYDSARSLIQQLLYYSDVIKRTYIRMEATLLLAIVQYRMGNVCWKDSLQNALDSAQEYHFVRLISREGAAIWELLKAFHWQTSDRDFVGQVMAETEKVALAYPGYLKNHIEGRAVFGENALKILRLQAQGLSNSEIGELLGIKESTVKYHSKQTYRKLGVKSKTAAVMEARRQKLI